MNMVVRTRIILLLLFSVLLVVGSTGCDTNTLLDGEAITDSSSTDLTPTSISLSIEPSPFFVSTTLTDPGAAAGSGSTDTTGIATSASTPVGTTGSGTDVSGVAVSKIADGGVVPTGTPLTAKDFVAGFDYTALIDLVMPAALTGACRFLNTYVALACDSSGTEFDIASTAITSDDAIIAQAYDDSGQSAHTLDAASITPKAISIEWLSNTRNNSTLSDSSQHLTVYDDKIYFNSLNSTGRSKLYEFDPANDTSTQISNTRTWAATPLDNPTGLTVFNNVLYWAGNGGTTPTQLTKIFSYDGTSLARISRTSGNDLATDSVTMIGEYNSKLLFVGNNNLYSYTAAAGVVQLTNSSVLGSSNARITNLGVFVDQTSGGHLYQYSESPTGVFQQVTTIGGGCHSASIGSNASIFHNSKLFFRAQIDGSGSDCGWMRAARYDGTTVQLIDQSAEDSGADVYSSPYFLGESNGLLLIAMNNSEGVYKLYAWNDTTEVLTPVSNLNSDQSIADFASPASMEFESMSDGFLLRGYLGSDSYLFRYRFVSGSTFTVERTSTVKMMDHTMHAFDDYVFFLGEDPDGYNRVYAYEPATGNTIKLADLRTAADEVFSSPVTLGSCMYFVGGVGKLHRLCID